MDKVNNNNDGGNNHSLRLFSRGKAMSGHPSINGRSQFPNPPIKTGITKKKDYYKCMSCNNSII